MQGLLVVEFEIDILDDEGPDFIAESVGIQVTLNKVFSLEVCTEIGGRSVP